MSELGDRLEAMRAALAALYPARVVTRQAKDPSQHPRADMEKGIYTLISLNEQNFTNVPGYTARDGRHGVLIVGDILMPEKATGSEVEEAELAMVDEIKAFVRDLPENLCQLDLMSWAQSGQLDRPNGWVIFQLEYQP